MFSIKLSNVFQKLQTISIKYDWSYFKKKRIRIYVYVLYKNVKRNYILISFNENASAPSYFRKTIGIENRFFNSFFKNED